MPIETFSLQRLIFGRATASSSTGDFETLTSRNLESHGTSTRTGRPYTSPVDLIFFVFIVRTFYKTNQFTTTLVLSFRAHASEIVVFIIAANTTQQIVLRAASKPALSLLLSFFRTLRVIFFSYAECSQMAVT